jgi:hypothetical protein
LSQQRQSAHKKGEFSRHFAFDLAMSHAYISRPRRFATVSFLRVVLLLWHDESSRRTALFDIVIRGRGTWAAVRSLLPGFDRAIQDRALARVLQSNMEKSDFGREPEIQTSS